MTFPYLHPVSLVSLLLCALLIRALRRRTAAERVTIGDAPGCLGSLLSLMAVPVVFSVVAGFTDPDTDGLLNVLMAQFTTWPLYLLAIGAADGSLSRRAALAAPLRAYRPARLQTERQPGLTPSRWSSWHATFLVAALLCAVFGVRFGEHLRARTLVAAQPSDYGQVSVLNAEGQEVARVPSAGMLRPGEIVCPEVKVDFTAPDGEVLRLGIAPNSGDTQASMATGNITENAWECERYTATVQRVPMPEELRKTWQGTPGSGAETDR